MATPESVYANVRLRFAASWLHGGSRMLPCPGRGSRTPVAIMQFLLLRVCARPTLRPYPTGYSAARCGERKRSYRTEVLSAFKGRGIGDSALAHAAPQLGYRFVLVLFQPVE